MSPGEHHAVLHVAVQQVDDAVEEERAPGRAGEARRDQLAAIRQRRVAAGAREEPRAAGMNEERSPHGEETKRSSG